MCSVVIAAYRNVLNFNARSKADYVVVRAVIGDNVVAARVNETICAGATRKCIATCHAA